MPYRTILVADPDPDSRVIYTALLESAGYTVHACASAEEIGVLAATLRPALVITELVVGGLDAWSLARAFTRDGTRPPPPMLLITADTRAHVQERAYRSGYTAWLTKPYDPERLLVTVRELVGPGGVMAAS